MTIAAIIFDFGYVLSLPPQPDDFRDLQRAGEIDSESFERLYWLYRDEYDVGALDGPGYWRRIAEGAGQQLSREQIDDLISGDIALWNRTNPTLIEWVRALKKVGLKTAVLSNMSSDLAAYMRREAAWTEPFDHLCFSGELRLAKPDPAIYHACLAGLQARPEEAILIDDRAENVEAARALGMQALIFQSLHQLAIDIRPLNLPAPLLAGPSGVSE